MTTYEFLQFLHVASAIIWLGAGFVLTLLIFGAATAGDREKEAGYHHDIEWLAPRLFIPFSLVTLITGLLVTLEGDLPFDLWLVIGLVGWLVSFGLGFFYFKPEGERIVALVEAEGPASEEADWRLHRLNLVDRVQVLILFVVVADMVIKPTGDDTGVLVAGAAIVAGATALATAMIRGHRTPQPTA